MVPVLLLTKRIGLLFTGLNLGDLRELLLLPIDPPINIPQKLLLLPGQQRHLLLLLLLRYPRLVPFLFLPDDFPNVLPNHHLLLLHHLPLNHTLIHTTRIHLTLHHRHIQLLFVRDRHLIDGLASGAFYVFAGTQLVAHTGFASVALEDAVGGEALDFVFAVETDEHGAVPWDVLLGRAVVAGYEPGVKGEGTCRVRRGVWGWVAAAVGAAGGRLGSGNSSRSY